MNSGYTWDSIDMWTEWNVKVLDVTGHLDIPGRKDPTEIDFGVDESGAEAFTDEADIVIKARDIILDCALKETTEERFLTKLAAFKSAITENGMHTLGLEHAVNDYQVYHRDRVMIQMLTKWNNTQNAARFRLVLRNPEPVYPMIWRALEAHYIMNDANLVYSAELMPNAADRNFTGGVTAWADVDLGGGFDETDNLTITATAADQYCTCPVLSVPTTAGKRYRLTFTVANLVATWTIKSFDGTQTIGTVSVTGAQSMEFTAATTGGLRIVAVATTSSGDFDDFSLKSITADDEASTTDATLYGSTSATDRESNANGARYFNGTSDYWDTGRTFQTTFRDSFSIAFWCKPDDGQPASWKSLCGFDDPTGADSSVFISIQTDGTINFRYECESDLYEAQTASAVFANGAESWHHVACVVDNDTKQMYIYFDGVKQTLGSSDGDITGVTMANLTTVKNVHVGARNSNGTADTFFPGSMADFRIYERAISYEEVKTIYHTQVDGTLDL